MELIRLAFFVEGLTEKEFLKRLIREIFGIKRVAIEERDITGGKKHPVSISKIESETLEIGVKYYILIYDCGGDGKIKSYILDQRESLINSGYKKIIGLRDVYPIAREEIHKLIYGLNFKVPQKDIVIKFVLSTMELEAFFLAEESHFLKIDDNLSIDRINEVFGFDPSSSNPELIDNPATLLNEIYSLEGKKYLKKKSSILKTVESLDYANMYFIVRNRVNSLNQLITEFEEVLVQ